MADLDWALKGISVWPPDRYLRESLSHNTSTLFSTAKLAWAIEFVGENNVVQVKNNIVLGLFKVQSLGSGPALSYPHPRFRPPALSLP